MSILNTGGPYGRATVSMSQTEHMRLTSKLAAALKVVEAAREFLEIHSEPGGVAREEMREALAAYDATKERDNNG